MKAFEAAEASVTQNRTYDPWRDRKIVLCISWVVLWTQWSLRVETNTTLWLSHALYDCVWMGTEKVCWCVWEKDKKDCMRPLIIIGTHHFKLWWVLNDVSPVPPPFCGSLTLIPLKLATSSPLAVGSVSSVHKVYLFVWENTSSNFTPRQRPHIETDRFWGFCFVFCNPSLEMRLIWPGTGNAGSICSHKRSV